MTTSHHLRILVPILPEPYPKPNIRQGSTSMTQRPHHNLSYKKQDSLYRISTGNLPFRLLIRRNKKNHGMAMLVIAPRTGKLETSEKLLQSAPPPPARRRSPLLQEEKERHMKKRTNFMGEREGKICRRAPTENKKRFLTSSILYESRFTSARDSPGYSICNRSIAAKPDRIEQRGPKIRAADQNVIEAREAVEEILTSSWRCTARE